MRLIMVSKYSRTFPGINRVTPVALGAVLAEVAVVLVMAGGALLRQFHRPWRLAMTIGALQLGMRSEQREVRLLGVIEHP